MTTVTFDDPFYHRKFKTDIPVVATENHLPRAFYFSLYSHTLAKESLSRWFIERKDELFKAYLAELKLSIEK